MRALDYRKIELYILSKMPSVQVEQFKAGTDLHRLRAVEMFGVPYESVTSEQRAAAKAESFRRIYG
ncbi:DNA polymerase [Burkholderia vietnamiensis]|uniref:DNA polymerase n=1 Tax=Burkholderia vietnamiensis TaxID=60552 RepID=UPI000759857D|nr:DNA polymerase [Burkholderia vietnamiensis]KVR95816.1 hypothetical protein WK28_01870 [Burkholderia vietnamiensis]